MTRARYSGARKMRAPLAARTLACVGMHARKVLVIAYYRGSLYLVYVFHAALSIAGETFRRAVRSFRLCPSA